MIPACLERCSISRYLLEGPMVPSFSFGCTGLLLNNFLSGADSDTGVIMPVSLPPGDHECHVHLTLNTAPFADSAETLVVSFMESVTKHMCAPSLEVLSSALTLRGFVNLHQHQLV